MGNFLDTWVPRLWEGETFRHAMSIFGMKVLLRVCQGRGEQDSGSYESSFATRLSSILVMCQSRTKANKVLPRLNWCSQILAPRLLHMRDPNRCPQPSAKLFNFDYESLNMDSILRCLTWLQWAVRSVSWKQCLKLFYKHFFSTYLFYSTVFTLMNNNEKESRILL